MCIRDSELSVNNMRDTKLTAPFDGSIEKRLVENYQRVNSGEGIVQLVNTCLLYTSRCV